MFNWQYWLQDWVDYQLNWNASEYGGIDSIRIHPKLIWTPDLLMYNRFEHPQFLQLLIHFLHITERFLSFPLFFSADEKFDGTYQTNVVVSNEGGCFMSPLGYLKVHVKLISHGSLSTISSAIWSSVPGHILGGRWVYCSVTLPFVITDSVVGWCTSLIIYGMFHYLQVEYRKASKKINNSFF